MPNKEPKPRPQLKKRRKGIGEFITYTYIRRIKKWMFCPVCKDGKMRINRSSTLWQCTECGYNLDNREFQDDYVFWFCDQCETYLNSQNGFDRNASKHSCTECGYENDTTLDNIRG